MLGLVKKNGLRKPQAIDPTDRVGDTGLPAEAWAKAGFELVTSCLLAGALTN